MMNLFDTIPSSVFILLTSKNRELYAKALLVMRSVFNEQISIQKEDLIKAIANSLQNDLLDLSPESDDEFNEDDLKDINGRARAIVNRFKETGWVECDYEKRNKLIEMLSLPPYSIKLLDLIYSFTSEELKEYDSFMYSIYSSLKSADEEYNDYRYLALVTAYDKIYDFESTLKGLFIDLKRHYNRMSRLKNINQLLNEHFDNYQRDIIKQIYLPLKTKDSIARFKGPVMNILSSWLRNEQILNDIITQAILHKKFINREDASGDVLTKINFITDKLISLQELLTKIDDKNQEYVQTATDKMTILLNKDKSVKAKFTKIVSKIAEEKLDNSDESLQLLQESFSSFLGQEFINEESLFIRPNAERDYGVGEEVTILDFDERIAQKALHKLEDEMNSVYSKEGIERFMHQQLDELESINTKDMNISDMNTLILVVYSFIKGFNPRSFYTMNINKGNVDNHNYSVPNVDFIRRR